MRVLIGRKRTWSNTTAQVYHLFRDDRGVGPQGIDHDVSLEHQEALIQRSEPLMTACYRRLYGYQMRYRVVEYQEATDLLDYQRCGYTVCAHCARRLAGVSGRPTLPNDPWELPAAISNRTFGVEIEAITAPGQSIDSVVRKLRSALCLNVRSESYNHHTRTHWKVVDDGSLHADDSTSETFELVSPVLKGKKGVMTLRAVLNVLKAEGVTTNKTCGLHVHHGVRDLEESAVIRAFAMYATHEDLFDSIQPRSRRENANSFCSSIRNSGVERAYSLRHLGSILGGRYVKVNIQSFWRYGTVEFRHHSGSVNADKVANWVMLTQKLVEYAAANQDTAIRDAGGQPVTTIAGLARVIGAGERAAAYFTVRAAALAA